MNFQITIILLLFVASVIYIGRMAYNNIAAKKSCGSNCKCGVDFSNIDDIKPGE